VSAEAVPTKVQILRFKTILSKASQYMHAPSEYFQTARRIASFNHNANANTERACPFNTLQVGWGL